MLPVFFLLLLFQFFFFFFSEQLYRTLFRSCFILFVFKVDFCLKSVDDF
jgi:hypothetical protein